MTSRPFTPDTTADLRERIASKIRGVAIDFDDRVSNADEIAADIIAEDLNPQLAEAAKAVDEWQAEWMAERDLRIAAECAMAKALDATHEAACRAMRDAVIDAQTDAQSAFLIASLPLPKREGG